MTWLARLSLTHRAAVGLVTAMVLVFGVISTTSLRQELFPSLDVPVLTVLTPYPGASPEVVEQQVTDLVETAVAGVDGVADTSSTSTGGSSVVTVNLEYGTDLADAATQAERAVQGARLPAELTPTVLSLGTGSIPVVQLAVSSNLPSERVAAVLRDQVRPLLAGLDGVGDVTLSGVEEPRVVIDVDSAAAAARGVSLPAVAALLQSNGVRVPAGQLTPGTDPLTVQVGAPITSVAQLGDLYLAMPGGAPVRLADIATITAGPAPATGYTRTDGVASIGVGVSKAEQANTVAVSELVRDALPRITEALGGPAQDARATVVFDQAPFIEQSVDDLTTEGLLGLLFAVLVILGFLLSVRATLVTAVSIPLSVLLAMIVLHLADYTLNILTLGALTVAIGRVVDDSIVVIENIKRHLGYGSPRREAILTAIGEVAGAITASTVTTVAVFAPIGLVGGQVGELFRPFAVTVTAALLASLVVSLTVVPVLASMVLRPASTPAPPPEPGAQPARTRLQRGYLPVLTAAVARPVVSLGIAVAILAGTVALVPLLQTNFLGDSGGDTLTVAQELEPGTALPQANAAAAQVEGVLAATPGIASYQVTVGSPSGGSGRIGPPRAAASTATRFTVTVAADGDDPDVDATTVAEDLRARLDGLDGAGVLTVMAGQGGFGGGQLAVDIRAEDPAVLAEAAQEVQRAVSGIPGATDVRNTLAAAQPVIDVAVDRRRAAAAGLTEAQIGQIVATTLRGQGVGSLTIDGVEQDVLLRTGAAPADLLALQALPVAGPFGPTTLGAVATVTRTATAPSISHTDGSRSAQVTARPAAEDLGTVTADLHEMLDGLVLPAGATAEVGGVSTQQNEAFAQLGLALLLAIGVVYLVMVLAFRSLLQPLLLLVAVPFAATGALGLLLVTGTPLGVPALIGMLMLVGIVVTNAIVLIDLVNQYRRAGRGLHESVVEGAAQRLRPIVMTAVATIFALLPMALGFTGGGSFISQPLAVVVIGGLITSTLLTLVLVPVLYVLAERRRAGRAPVPDETPTVGATRAVPVAPTGPGAHGIVTDLHGVALAGAAVALFDTEGRPLGATTADGHGRYRVALPGAGEYLLVAHAADGRAPGAEWLTAAGVTARRDLAVQGPAHVEGHVRLASGTGVAAVVTIVDDSGAVVAGTRADGQGRFRLAHVPAGEHHLLVAPVTGPSALRRLSVPVTGAVRCDVELGPSGVLTGTVRSGGGRGIGDALTTVSAADGTVVGRVRTAADGSFHLAGLPDGSYTVTASAGVPAVRDVHVHSDRVTTTELELGDPEPGAAGANGLPTYCRTAAR